MTKSTESFVFGVAFANKIAAIMAKSLTATEKLDAIRLDMGAARATPEQAQKVCEKLEIAEVGKRRIFAALVLSNADWLVTATQAETMARTQNVSERAARDGLRYAKAKGTIAQIKGAETKRDARADALRDVTSLTGRLDTAIAAYVALAPTDESAANVQAQFNKLAEALQAG